MLIVLILAISLSMDAFSLSLAYGTLNLNIKSILKLSFIVGFFHLIMPMLGMCVGYQFFSILPFDSGFIVFSILIIIGIGMCLDTLKNETNRNLNNLFSYMSFGLAVSIDSFSVGIGIYEINSNILFCASAFAISSFLFTLLGLVIGREFNRALGKISIFIGGLVLIAVAFFYLFH